MTRLGRGDGRDDWQEGDVARHRHTGEVATVLSSTPAERAEGPHWLWQVELADGTETTWHTLNMEAER